MTLRAQFGRRLRQLRREQDLTQEQLAEQLDLSPEFVSGMERGLYAPSFETLERLEGVLGVALSALFDFSALRAGAEHDGPPVDIRPAIFVFTAANARAQQNLARSISSPIPDELLFRAFDEAEHPRLRQLREEAGAFHAWGATPSMNGSNERVWEAMEPGDYVLAVWANHYRYVARVLATYDHPRFARSLWGTENDQTWQYLYLLSPPWPVQRPISDLDEHLWKGYRGFSRIGPNTLQVLVERYGSVDAFIEQEFPA